jgi:hypothetical protein
MAGLTDLENVSCHNRQCNHVFSVLVYRDFKLQQGEQLTCPVCNRHFGVYIRKRVFPETQTEPVTLQ